MHGFAADVDLSYRSDCRVVEHEGRVVAVARNQDEALASIGSAAWVLMEKPEMIALENVISVARPTGTKVAAALDAAEEVRGAAFALDVGVDALVLRPPLGPEDDLWEAAVIARAQRAERVVVEEPAPDGRPVDLEVATVTRVEPGVVADRVAVDLVRLLRPGEGALVGSSAKALALVHGETLPSPLVAPRPFRVNAGPVHAYALLADAKTKYLSELEPGDHILVVDVHARTARPVAVGRLKIETRPHLLVSFAHEVESDTLPREGQLFLQQAETVRLVSSDCEPLCVTDLKPGHRIFVSFAKHGTHCGRPIDARVVER
ncbi:hypothetical protein CTAYLR_002767 [Chrysophaeum taylorii]|uniref:3-dehydroquinate synthase C-terminal domain-containing protein n=1 Tax=Chrysophaeum taylorii TaxID=2483200 RepID=A0AAD7UD18_9STRA|nr:hypothetical protein CTAYLR_002767 [Chrysophaeum taylorii]